MSLAAWWWWQGCRRNSSFRSYVMFAICRCWYQVCFYENRAWLEMGLSNEPIPQLGWLQSISYYICTIIYNPWLLALPLLWWNFAVPSWGGLGQPYPSQENSFVTCCRMLPLCLAMHQVRDRLGNHAKSWYTQWLIVSTHWAIGCSWNGIFSIHMGSNYLSFSLLVDSFCAGANMFQPMALMFCSEA